MLETTEADLLDKPVREAPLPEPVRKALLKSLTPDGDKAFEVMLESENERYIAATVSPVLVETQVQHDTITDGWVIVLQDVTHLRKAEIARAEFIQTTAHDMRNPLSITLSSINMLKDIVSTSDEDAHEVIDLAIGGVKRLRTLVDDLLQLEHIESGYNFSMEWELLPEVLHEVSKEIMPLMADKDLDFTQDIRRQSPRCRSRCHMD